MCSMRAKESIGGAFLFDERKIIMRTADGWNSERIESWRWRIMLSVTYTSDEGGCFTVNYHIGKSQHFLCLRIAAFGKYEMYITGLGNWRLTGSFVELLRLL